MTATGMGSTRIAGAVELLFGAVTVLAGGRVLTGAEAGAVAPFVLWSDTLAGLTCMAAGAGLWTGRRRAAGLSVAACWRRAGGGQRP